MDDDDEEEDAMIDVTNNVEDVRPAVAKSWRKDDVERLKVR